MGHGGEHVVAEAIKPVELGVSRPQLADLVGDGQLAVATVMTCTLSVDHRSVDGAVGAAFLAEFKKFIELPYSLVV